MSQFNIFCVDFDRKKWAFDVDAESGQPNWLSKTDIEYYTSVGVKAPYCEFFQSMTADVCMVYDANGAVITSISRER